ncbi:MAG: MATE family efflux transporter [Lentisphaeria bacterium]
MSEQKDFSYTKMPIRPLFFKISMSMIPATLAISGYNIADTCYIGHLPGAESLAAMGFTFPVIMLAGCIFHGFADALMTFTAQLNGAKKQKATRTFVTAGLVMLVLIAAFIALLGVFTCPMLFKLFGASGKTLELAITYMNIWYAGCITIILALSGNDLLIACGNPKYAAWMMMLSMLINVILDPILIFGLGPIPGKGIAGAAIATILSQGIGAVCILSMAQHKYHLIDFKSLTWKTILLDWKQLFAYAIPAILGMLLMPIGNAVIIRITAEFGVVAVAAVAAAGRIEMLAFVIPMSVGMAVMPYMGQNFGAGFYQRIHDGRKFVMRFAFGFLLTSGTLIFLFRRQIVPFFSIDPAVQEIMIQYLSIVVWGLWGVEVHRFSNFTFTGCGKPKFATFLTIMRVVLFLIPFALIALYFHSLKGLFIARFSSDVISAVIAYFCAHHLTTKLIRENKKVELFR